MNKKLITIISAVMAFIIAGSGIILGITLKKQNETITDTFAFCSVSGGDKKDLTFTYSNTYFKNDATEYNHELAQMSLRMALSAMNSGEDGPAGAKDYSEKSKNIVDLLGKCHFTDITVNDDYKNKPTANSIGVCVAQKKIGKMLLWQLPFEVADMKLNGQVILTATPKEMCIRDFKVLHKRLKNLLKNIFRLNLVTTRRALLKKGM